MISEEKDEEIHLNRTQNPAMDNRILQSIMENDGTLDTEILQTIVEEGTDEIWINTTTSNSTKFHLKHDKKKGETPFEEQIPMEYHEYLEIFDKTKSDQFPC